jgi:hypothetical protein
MKLETKLRSTLRTDRLVVLPNRVVPDGFQPSVPNRESETVRAQDNMGSAVAVSAKRLAAEAGLSMHASVTLKKTTRKTSGHGASEKTMIGKIQAIDNAGVHVTWCSGKTEVLAATDLAPASKQKASSQEPEGLTMPACKWAMCSSSEKLKLWSHMAQATLYQAYVSQSAAHHDVRVVSTPDDNFTAEGPWRLHAVHDCKPRTLLFLPWNAALIKDVPSRPKDAVPVVMIAQPDREQETCVTFWLRLRPKPRTWASSQDRASVLVLFSVLAAKPKIPVPDQATADGECHNHVHTLVYQKACIDVPILGPLAKGVRVQRARIRVCLPCMTNVTAVRKGDQLVVAGPPPCLWTVCSRQRTQTKCRAYRSLFSPAP